MKAFGWSTLLVWALPVAALAADCRLESTFLGFSQNERGWAEVQAFTCHPRAGVTDRFSLARVFDGQGGRLTGTFRMGSPSRRSTDGHLVAVAPATWAANYPAYRQAMGQRAWSVLSRAAHFRRLQYAFEDDAVRFRPLHGGVARVQAMGKEVALESAAHARLEFVAVARTKDGDQLELAHFQGRAHERVRVRFYFSPSGRRLAMHVIRADGSANVVGTEQSLPSPIDSPDIGAINVMTWESDAARRDFERIGDGPHTADVDAFVADTFQF
jgi:hypothetical protein